MYVKPINFVVQNMFLPNIFCFHANITSCLNYYHYLNSSMFINDLLLEFVTNLFSDYINEKCVDSLQKKTDNSKLKAINSVFAINLNANVL